MVQELTRVLFYGLPETPKVGIIIDHQNLQKQPKRPLFYILLGSW